MAGSIWMKRLGEKPGKNKLLLIRMAERRLCFKTLRVSKTLRVYVPVWDVALFVFIIC